MQAQPTTITVPAWVFQLHTWVVHNWTTVLGVVIVALLSSVFVELSKRSRFTTNDAAKLKRLATWLMVMFATMFSWLAYALFFVQANLSWFQSLPIVGSHTAEALGIGFAVYNLRLNKWYKAAALKWGKKPATETFGTTTTASTDVAVDALD